VTIDYPLSPVFLDMEILVGYLLIFSFVVPEKLPEFIDTDIYMYIRVTKITSAFLASLQKSLLLLSL